MSLPAGFLNVSCWLQTLLKSAVRATRKSLDRDAPAPKTATQEAMQAQVSSAALQSDTLKASALAAEVSSAPQGAAPPAKQVVLLIHGGAQGGWVWSYPNEVCAHSVQELWACIMRLASSWRLAGSAAGDALLARRQQQCGVVWLLYGLYNEPGQGQPCLCLRQSNQHFLRW